MAYLLDKFGQPIITEYSNKPPEIEKTITNDKGLTDKMFDGISTGALKVSHDQAASMLVFFEEEIRRYNLLKDDIRKEIEARENGGR